MGASQFVGRVGGLALALGIGAGVFAGSAGVAWAEESARDSGTSGSSADSGSDSSQAGPSTRGRTTTAVRGSAAAEPAGLAAPATAAEEPISLPDLEAIVDPEPVVEAVTGVADAEPQPADADPEPVDQPVAYTEPAPAATTVVPLQTTSAPTAKADSAPLTAAPVTTYFDGILQGNLNVTSTSGCGLLGSTCKLTYTFVDSSDGGKVTFGNVPAALSPLLPEGAKGGAGSFTFLPYATWIDPADPTNFPVATGTQTFSVRISEDTQFNQTITSIPLIGLFAAPIIDLLQQLPLIGSLLAPLIGASLVQTVNVNVGALVSSGVTKQVAYTYIVDSFDGTPISMNYFPASAPSLVLDGQKQATIFNGPGLGSPGETNPYGLFQAAGSVPGLGLMRGQGLPTTPIDFSSFELGFNVITWDPRGEWNSGGVLQLDNPFYEGRDVSALIDWALANTPLLSEDVREDRFDPDSDVVAKNVPSIAMMGGSYGGGIQLTTVDPRIKAIVPSIAWNSLNQSLYPNDVFKTGWANALADALLFTGASSIGRINAQVTEALITGNLFGFISQAGQAVLASSGPTTLLSKLNAPVMFNQGIVDALFPLQQATENALTLIEQNPYLNGTIGDADGTGYPRGVLPKLIWFCGGHGVCTTQTTEQLTKQATVMFLQDLIWVNQYTKEYLVEVPTGTLPPPIPGFISTVGQLLSFINQFQMGYFQWWDQNGTALTAVGSSGIPGVDVIYPWSNDFQDAAPVVATNATGGQINSFTSVSGPLTANDPAGAVCAGIKQACEYPLNQVFATKANNAVNVDIPVPYLLGPSNPAPYVVGEPLVSFSYSGIGNAKAVYAQIVDDATGQVLGNINTPIPVTLDGKERTIDAFPIANIVYTAPVGGGSLTLQLVANSSLFKNNAVIWSVNISDVEVQLPRTTTATVVPNPIASLLP